MSDKKIVIIGLGYVGLPLAVEFAKKYNTIGFDINQSRIEQLNRGLDKTLEIAPDDLKSVLKIINDEKIGLFCTKDSLEIQKANVYIVTVPTPIDKNNKPDLTPLLKASATVGKVLKKGDIVIYESTVYPGATEEECVPILEKESGLVFNIDFFCGYSPERINPGDKEHTVAKILKVTSGSTPEKATEIDDLYASIITAGTFKASSIKVAEAAKVIENSQRDINIAFINELSKIFTLLGISTQDVLAAAGTKWNFLPFKPGLVGGHCIGVDPYYLAQKAQEVGYHPEIILAGRRLNDSMGAYVASQAIKLIINRDFKVKEAKVLILGLTFKENCPDIRNTRIIDIYKELISYGLKVSVYDPWADAQEVKKEFGFELISKLDKDYHEVIIAVAHEEFKMINAKELLIEKGCVYDLKGILPKDMVDLCL